MVCLVFLFTIMVLKFWMLFFPVQKWTANPMRACLLLHMVGFWSGLTNGPLTFCVWLNEKAICPTVVDESSCESSINERFCPEEEHQRMFLSQTSAKLTRLHGIAVNPEMDETQTGHVGLMEAQICSIDVCASFLFCLSRQEWPSDVRSQ